MSGWREEVNGGIVAWGEGRRGGGAEERKEKGTLDAESFPPLPYPPPAPPPADRNAIT